MMKVLVVDGHTETRRALVAALSRIEGLVVQCSIPDHETALRVLWQYSPELLVIGTRLADGEGLALVEMVRRPGMSIVVVGAAASRDVWRGYLAAGADRFVEPDVGFVELREVVGALVRHRAARPAAPPAAPMAARPPEQSAAPPAEPWTAQPAPLMSDQRTERDDACPDAVPDAPVRAAGSGPTRVPTRASSGIVHAFNNHIHSIELILEVLERSPGDKHLWTEARIALERAVCMTALLLGHVHGHRRRGPGPARGARGTPDSDPSRGPD